MYDYAIVGNGILGLSLAFRLKKDNPELKIALIGPSSRKGGATVAAAAMLNVWAEIGEGLFEDESLSSRFEIGKRGMHLWRSFADELEEVTGETIQINWGTYVIDTPMSAPWGDNTWSYFVDSLKKQEVEHQLIEPNQIPYLRPSQHNRVLNAVKIPDGSLDILHVMNVLENALSILSIDVYDTTVESIISGDGENKLLLQEGGSLKCKDAILANGAFAQELVDQIEEIKQQTPRLLWGAGSAIDLSFPDWVQRYNPDWPIFNMQNVMRTLNPVGACGLYILPEQIKKEGDRVSTFYVGASSAVLFEREWNPRIHASAFLMDHVMHEVNRDFFYTTVELRGNGFRPMTVDGFPLLGESAVKGIWFFNGMKRDGLTSAPYLVKEFSHQLSGEQSLLPDAFTPSRKLISYKDQTQAIDDTVLFALNADRQHGLKLPAWGEEKYISSKKQEINVVYEKRNIVNFGIHPEVIHLYADDEYYKHISHPI